MRDCGPLVLKARVKGTRNAQIRNASAGCVLWRDVKADREGSDWVERIHGAVLEPGVVDREVVDRRGADLPGVVEGVLLVVAEVGSAKPGSVTPVNGRPSVLGKVW